MKRGQKHLIKCRCVLPQFKNKIEPPVHQFIVFSVINENDDVEISYSQCNNCGLIHKITDICKSEILSGKESLKSLMSIDDIKANIPEKLNNILERYEADITTYQHAAFIIENKIWGEFILLSSEIEDSVRHGKSLQIIGEMLYKIDSFTKEEFINES